MNLLVFADRDLRELELLSKLPTGITLNIAYELEDLDKYASWADAFFICKLAKNRESLQRVLSINPKLKWVQSWWTGVDSLLYPEIIHHDIIVTNARGLYAPPLAEFTLFACLYFAKNYLRLESQKGERKWQKFEAGRLFGKTIGIFGLGEIGLEIARRAVALDMKVIASKRRCNLKPAGSEKYEIIPFQESDRLFKEADFVVNAAPLTHETKGFIDYGKLSLMKKDAVFINVGRGPVVVEADLVRVLNESRIKGAALDVFEVEPLPPTSPLWNMENVIISPHSADQYDGWLTPPFEFFVENCTRFFEGKPLLNVVDKAAGY